MEINRDIYLQRLIERRHNGMAKVVTGLRRSGKSYLLFNIFYKWLLDDRVSDNHIIKVNLENFANAHLRDPHKLYEYVTARINDNDMHYILLDEVQMVPQFEDVLNGFMSLGNTDIYVTGSNAKYLSKDVITEFRGRGDEVSVCPLSFKEFMSGFDGSKASGLDQYMQYGGLPQILSLPTEEQKSSFLSHLVKETYLRDIKERHNLRKDKEMDDLVDILASSIGALTNPSIIANTFNTQYKSRFDADSIKSYIEHLTDSFLVERCKRFDVKGRRYINSPYKYYFTDLGLRNGRLGFSQIDPGHMMENVIYNELRIRGFNVDVGCVPIRKKNIEGKIVRSQLEVDFIAHIGNRRYYIQSAYEMRDEEKMPVAQYEDRLGERLVDNGCPLFVKCGNSYLAKNHGAHRIMRPDGTFVIGPAKERGEEGWKPWNDVFDLPQRDGYIFARREIDDEVYYGYVLPNGQFRILFDQSVVYAGAQSR